MKKLNTECELGFTQLELLIAMGILSILMLIAVPTYLNYMVRAKLSEVFTMSAHTQTLIQEYYVISKKLPKDNTAAGMKIGESYGSEYIQSIDVSKDGLLTVQLKETDKLRSASSGSIVFRPQANDAGKLSWSCSSTSVANKLLPVSCQS